MHIKYKWRRLQECAITTTLKLICKKLALLTDFHTNLKIRTSTSLATGS